MKCALLRRGREGKKNKPAHSPSCFRRYFPLPVGANLVLQRVPPPLPRSHAIEHPPIRPPRKQARSPPANLHGTCRPVRLHCDRFSGITLPNRIAVRDADGCGYCAYRYCPGRGHACIAARIMLGDRGAWCWVVFNERVAHPLHSSQTPEPRCRQPSVCKHRDSGSFPRGGRSKPPSLGSPESSLPSILSHTSPASLPFPSP